MTSVRSDQKLPPRWTEPVLAGSKMDPLQGTAEQTGQASGTSVITQLRVKNAAQQQLKGRNEKM